MRVCANSNISSAYAAHSAHSHMQAKGISMFCNAVICYAVLHHRIGSVFGGGTFFFAMLGYAMLCYVYVTSPQVFLFVGIPFFALLCYC